MTLRVYDLPDVIGTIEAQFTNEKLNTTINIFGNQSDRYIDFDIPAIIMMFSVNAHVYIYFTSAQLGETILKVEIPIIPRPRPDEFDYTPEQIQGYNQLLEQMQQVINDGVSPTLSVTSIEGGNRINITDVNGTKSFDVMDGQDGVDGKNGVSPTVTVTTITGGHRITITDAGGSKSFDVMDGKDGTGSGGSGSSGSDGVSPTVEITEIQGGHTISITDVNGTTTFNVMDGAAGEAGKGVPSGGSSGQVLVKSSSTNYDTAWKTEEIKITLDENGNGTLSIERK